MHSAVTREYKDRQSAHFSRKLVNNTGSAYWTYQATISQCISGVPDRSMGVRGMEQLCGVRGSRVRYQCGVHYGATSLLAQLQ